MSKMGISTVQSYRGAQIFEAIGIGDEVIKHYFPGTASQIGGIPLDVIAQEVWLRHREAYHDIGYQSFTLNTGGNISGAQTENIMYTIRLRFILCNKLPVKMTVKRIIFIQI